MAAPATARPTPAHDRLRHLAELLDRAAPAPGDAFFHASDDGDAVVLGILPLVTGRHPCDELRGLTAPAAWWAVGLAVAGRARFLDEPDCEPEPIRSTYFVERGGAEVSLLRRGHELTELPGRAEGRIPDLLRSMLALP